MLLAQVHNKPTGKCSFPLSCLTIIGKRDQPLTCCHLHTDLDNDGYIPVQDLASTESIERKLVEDVIDDKGA